MHHNISKVQSEAVAALLDDARANATSKGLTNEDRATVQEIVLQVPWVPEHRDAVLKELSLFNQDPLTCRKRSVMQDFKACLSMLTEVDWDLLLDKNMSSEAKLTYFIAVLIRLGLRCPTEETKRRMTSAWLLVSFSGDEITTMTGGTKKGLMEHVKTEFKKVAKKAAPPADYVTKLPADRQAFCQQHPDLYRAAFPDSSIAPVLCKLAVDRVIALDSSWDCRGLNSKQAPCTTVAVPPPGEIRLPREAEQFAGQMFSMQKQQMMFMQQMMAQQMGGRSGSMNVGGVFEGGTEARMPNQFGALKSLLGSGGPLTAPVGSPYRRLPTLDIGEATLSIAAAARSPVADSPSVPAEIVHLAVADRPIDAAGAEQAAAVSIVGVGADTGSEAVAPASGAGTPGTGYDPLEMLDMIDTRDRERAEAAKLRAAAKRQELKAAKDAESMVGKAPESMTAVTPPMKKRLRQKTKVASSETPPKAAKTTAAATSETLTKAPKKPAAATSETLPTATKVE